MRWVIDVIKGEATAAYGLVVVGVLFFIAAYIGEFFGGVGDKVFDKEESNETSESP